MLKNNLAFILPISLGRVLRMPLHLQDGGTSTPCWHYMSWPVSRQRKKKEEHQSIEMNNWVQWEQKDMGRARNARCSVYLSLSLTFSASSSLSLSGSLFHSECLSVCHHWPTADSHAHCISAIAIPDCCVWYSPVGWLCTQCDSAFVGHYSTQWQTQERIWHWKNV